MNHDLFTNLVIHVPKNNYDNNFCFACGVYRVLQFPPEGWLRMSIGHCGITWVTIRPNGRVSVKSMGDTGHLPPVQMSS